MNLKREKRDNRLKLIDIIEYVDYNAPADGRDIIYIKVPNPAPNAKKTVKAFRVFGHIFIVPERYLFNTYYTKNLGQPNNQKTGAVYDPDYLSTDEAKSDFLKKITLLLKRIGYTNTGQSLFKALINGLPLKDFQGNYQQETFNSCSSVELVDQQGNSINKRMTCSLIIYGPTANCVKNKTVWITDENNTALTKNGHGTIAEIIFNPDLFHTFITDTAYNNCVPSQKTFVQDPAISLFHEMIHALHINYGSAMNEGLPITKRNRSIAADEFTIVSKSDQEKIPYNIIKDYDTHLKDNLNRIVDTLNNLTITFNETKIKTLYQNKYFLDYDPATKKYSWTKDKFDKLIGLIRYSLYEENLSKELNVLARKSYLDLVEPSIFRANILDGKTYTINEGFNINGGYSGQKTDNTKLIRENSAIATLIKICSPRLKRNIPTANLCIEIDSDQIIQISNNDYSDYKTVYTIDDKPIDPVNIEENPTLYFPKTDEPIQIPLPDTQVEKITLKSEEWATKQFLKTENIKLSKPSRYHILKAQQYDKELDPKKDRIQFIEADGKEETIIQSIQDNKKFYSYFPKSNKLINRTESFASAYLYAQWITALINDIREESNEEKITKISEDVIQIVPYIGAAYNVGKDIAEGEFIKAFIDTGIGMLLLFSPKIIIPLAIYDITTKIVQSKDTSTTDENNNLKKIENTLNNAFATRATYLRSYTTEMLYMWWGHIYLEVEDMIYNLEQQLNNYKQSILHNIHYHGLKVLETDKKATLQSMNYYKDHSEMMLDIHIEKALKNAAAMLALSAKKHLKEKWNTNIIEKLKAYDEQAALKLNTFIDTDAKGIPDATINLLKDIIRKTFNPSGLDQILNDKEINKTIDRIISDSNPFLTLLEINQSKIICQVEVIIDKETEARKIIDTTKQTEITGSQNINYLQTPNGRQTNCILFEEKKYIQLEKNELLSKTSLKEDFTWSFWIRHPMGTDDGLENEQPIIEFRDKENPDLEFAFILVRGFIFFKINTVIPNGFKSHKIFGGNIEDDKWHKLTLSYDSTNQWIYLYNNNFLTEKRTTVNLNKNTYNANLKIGLLNNKNTRFFFKIEQFKAYAAFFTQETIILSYNEDMGNNLYDHWGEPLRYNTKYYLNHIPLEGHKTIKYHLSDENSPYYFAKDIKKEEFQPDPAEDPYPELHTGDSFEFYALSELAHPEQTEIQNRSLIMIKQADYPEDLYLYNDIRIDYHCLIFEKTDSNKRSKIFQLNALREEIRRIDNVFDPYSIILTGTTSEGYNDGAFLNFFRYNTIFYAVDKDAFQVNRNALVKTGKSPFIQSIENEDDDYIKRYCWTFVPQKIKPQFTEER